MNTDAKFLNKIRPNPAACHKDYVPQSSRIHPRIKDVSKKFKSINIMQDINRLKDKNHMIISTDAKIYKTLFTFLFKTFNKLGIEEHTSLNKGYI
jgi:hypothetical protein